MGRKHACSYSWLSKHKFSRTLAYIDSCIVATFSTLKQFFAQYLRFGRNFKICWNEILVHKQSLLLYITFFLFSCSSPVSGSKGTRYLNMLCLQSEFYNYGNHAIGKILPQNYIRGAKTN